MKKSFILLLLLAAPALGQLNGNFLGSGQTAPAQDWFTANQTALCQYPYRKLEDERHCYLGKLFDWVKMNPQYRPTVPKPMDWDGMSGTVQAAGILEDAVILAPAWNQTKLFALKHYPLKSKLVDGQLVVFFAFKSSPYRWGAQSIPSYDFGVPFDPKEIAAAQARTNQPTATNTASTK